MKWWKKALIGTGVLLVISVALLFVIHETSSGSSQANARSNLLGKLCGLLMVVNWAYFFARHNHQKYK